MKITEQHKIYYFIKDSERGDFYDIQMNSYLEIPQNDGTSNFKQIEKIRLFYYTDLSKHEVAGFNIDFGKHDCMYAFEKSAESLIMGMTRKDGFYNYKVATQEEYLELRTKAFEIFNKQTCIDYDTLKIGEEF